MILIFAILHVFSAEVLSGNRCPNVSWEKPGDSVILKWGKNMEAYGEGSMNVKLLIRKNNLQPPITDFTVAVVFQRCLPENVTQFRAEI